MSNGGTRRASRRRPMPTAKVREAMRMASLEPDADIATQSQGSPSGSPSDGAPGGRLQLEVELADRAKGPIGAPQGQQAAASTLGERPPLRELLVHRDDDHGGRNFHRPLMASAAEREDGPSQNQARTATGSGSGTQPEVERQIRKTSRFSRGVAARPGGSSAAFGASTGSGTGSSGNRLPSSQQSVPGSSRWPGPGQSADVPFSKSELEAAERPLSVRLNDLKGVADSLRMDKEIAYEHLALVKSKLKEAEDTIVRLNSQAEASRKLISTLRENLPVSDALPRAGDSVTGVRKPLRKRKSFKATLEKLRVAVVSKMGEKLSGVDTIQTKMILTLDDKYLRGAACRAVRTLAKPEATGAIRSRTSAMEWVPASVPVIGGEGTIRISRPVVNGNGAGDQFVPENPLAAAQRPIYGGGLIALPGMVGRRGSPCEYGALTRHWAISCMDQGPLSQVDTPDAGDFKRAADKVAGTEVRGAVQSSVLRAVAELKKALSDKFFKLTFPVGATKHLLSSLENRQKLAVAHSLGAGKLRRNGGWESLSMWKDGLEKNAHVTANPFAHWRGLTPDELHRNVKAHLSTYAPRSSEETNDSRLSDGCESDMDGDVRLDVAPNMWGPQTDARDAPGGAAVDRLFRNSHAVSAIQSFMGFPSMRSGNVAEGMLHGTSSVLSIARADAWMATVLAIARDEAEVDDQGGDDETDGIDSKRKRNASASTASRGSRNHKFNAVFENIFPLSVEALLLEIRGVLEQWATGGNGDAQSEDGMLTDHAKQLGMTSRSVELHAPFPPDVATEMRAYFKEYDEIYASKEAASPTRRHGSDVGLDDDCAKSEEVHAEMNLSPVGSSAHEGQSDELGSQEGESRVHDAIARLNSGISKRLEDALAKVLILEDIHNGDEFLVKQRKATTAFAVKNKKSSVSAVDHFLALKPDFFKSEVCYWFGDVLDAYVGQWKACTADSSSDVQQQANAKENGTFYHPMRFRDLSTHLDSNEIEMRGPRDVSEDGSELDEMSDQS